MLRVTREDLADMGMTDFDSGIGKLCTHIDLRNLAVAETMRGLISTCDVFSQIGPSGRSEVDTPLYA